MRANFAGRALYRKILLLCDNNVISNHLLSPLYENLSRGPISQNRTYRIIASIKISRPPRERPGRDETRDTAILEICLVGVISSVIRSDVMLTSRYKKDSVFI